MRIKGHFTFVNCSNLLAIKQFELFVCLNKGIKQ